MTKSLAEVLDDLDVERHLRAKLTHRLESHRELAVRALERLINEAQTIREGLSQEDADAWLWAARNTAGHAGYSNTVASNAADVLAECGMIAGLIEGAV